MKNWILTRTSRRRASVCRRSFMPMCAWMMTMQLRVISLNASEVTFSRTTLDTRSLLAGASQVNTIHHPENTLGFSSSIAQNPLDLLWSVASTWIEVIFCRYPRAHLGWGHIQGPIVAALLSSTPARLLSFIPFILIRTVLKIILAGVAALEMN